MKSKYIEDYRWTENLKSILRKHENKSKIIFSLERDHVSIWNDLKWQNATFYLILANSIYRSWIYFKRYRVSIESLLDFSQCVVRINRCSNVHTRLSMPIFICTGIFSTQYQRNHEERKKDAGEEEIVEGRGGRKKGESGITFSISGRAELSSDLSRWHSCWLSTCSGQKLFPRVLPHFPFLYTVNHVRVIIKQRELVRHRANACYLIPFLSLSLMPILLF